MALPAVRPHPPEATMQVWIGTSGYSYLDWVGSFYPAGTRPNQMLRHYCKHFPLVELNFTFYRPPTPAILARLADQTPAGFQFLVKVPRSISHEENPRDLPEFRVALEQLRQRGRLLGVLCQLPQACHYGKKQLAWIDRLARHLAGCGLAVEFRHRSWFRPDVPAWLAERRVDLVSVDVPDLPGLYPRGLVQSGPRVYVRFHSRNAVNWYLSDRERYDYTYPDEGLLEWLTALAGRAGQTRSAYLLLNNCRGGQAVNNARRLRELVPRMAPEFDVVEPFTVATPEPRQLSLFD
jgi:uncharacterized protein YecE (DUF72 family)